MTRMARFRSRRSSYPACSLRRLVGSERVDERRILSRQHGAKVQDDLVPFCSSEDRKASRSESIVERQDITAFGNERYAEGRQAIGNRSSNWALCFDWYGRRDSRCCGELRG